MRILRSIINIAFVVAAIAMTMSCKPGVPDDYIQPGEMEDILYDYHIAMAMADQGDPAQRDVRQAAYKAAVLRKYGYTDKQMQASMEYYMRHTERLHDIYDNLSERLNDEAKDLGAGGTTNMAAKYNQNGDTTNIWKGPQSLILMPEPGFNSYSFEVKVDSSFHADDRIQLQCNASYIIQEGSRNAVAVVAYTLANDSVASQVMRIASNSYTSSTFGGMPDQKIKAIRGYILFPPDNGVVAPTTLKILCLTDIYMLRIHAPKPTAPATGQPGATTAPSGPQPGSAPGGPAPTPPMPVQQGPAAGTVPTPVQAPRTNR